MIEKRRCIVYLNFVRDVAPVAIAIWHLGLTSSSYHGRNMSGHDKVKQGVMGKKQLSPNRIDRIKQIVFNHFPLETGELEEKAWSSCRKAIDEHSRKLKRPMKN